MGNDQNQQDPFAQAAAPDMPVTRDTTERVFGMGVRPNGSLAAALQQHHAERAAQAEMYRKVAADALGVLHTGDRPKNPQTGAYLTPDEIDKLTQQKDYAVQQYGKLVGVNKEAKGALEKAHGIIDFITGAKQRQAQMAAPPTPQYGTNVSDAGVSTSSPVGPPPTAGPTPQYASNVSDAGVTYDPRKAMTPPPQSPKDAARQAAYQQKLSALESSITAPFNQQGVAFNTSLQNKRREMLSTQQTQHEIWEDEAKKLFDPGSKEYKWYSATGKLPPASNQRPPRPAGSYSTSVLDARKRASNGEVFFSPAGDPIDLDVLDPSMGLKGVMVYDEDSKKWGVRYEPFSPNQDVVKIGGVGVAVNKMDKSKIPEGAGTELGPAQIATTTATHSPETGQTTVSTKTPQITGVPGRNGISAPPPAPQGRTAGVPSVAPPPAAPSGKAGVGGGVPKVSKVAPTELPALDENGHIPATVVAKSTPQVVEGANQLLDGKDVKDLPAKTKELSASMARHYGWEQGKFTPREQGALRNATQFIDDMLSDPSTFAVLDDTMSRLKLNQVLAGAGHQGTISSAASTLAAKNMSDNEAKFIRQYNIITQTLAGIAPAIRGSGNRTTEAAIQRLLTDMPNPKTVQGAKDGMERLQLLKKEVQRALAKGQFTEADAAAATVPTRKGATPPPSPGTAQLSPAARKYLESQGIKVP